MTSEGALGGGCSREVCVALLALQHVPECWAM